MMIAQGYKKPLIIATVFLLPLWLFSRTTLNINDLLKGKYSTRKVQKFAWRPGSNQFSYIKENTLILEGVDTLSTRKICSLSEISDYSGNAFNRFPQYKWLSTNDICLSFGTIIITYNVVQEQFTSKIVLNCDAQNIDINQHLAIAYTIGNNLWVSDSLGTTIQITNEKSDITSGGNYVYREEFGTSKGTFWSPSGLKLAYYRNDETGIADYPLLDYTGDVTETRTIKYPFAGNSNQRVTLCVYDMKTHETVTLKTGNTDEYLTNPTWTPDENSMVVSVLNRDQNNLVVKKFDVRTGSLVAELIKDSSKSYIEPVFPVFFPVKSDSVFVFVSRRDGFTHMYRYTGNGVCLGQIDPGKHEVIDIQRCDPSGNVIYYMASEYDNPTERHAWKADIRTSKNTRITSIPGVHTVSVSDDGLVIDSLSSLTIPLDYNILNRDGKKIKQVYSGKNSTQGYDIPRTELLTITAADDSTKLYGSIIKPENFDSTKQYPLLVYVYGGPRVQLITNKWTMNTGLLPYMMASQGFVVFVLDNRGSMARGAAFEQCTFRNLGSCEVQDQLRGIAFMKTKRYIDSTRIGVYGWSYGGYMTLKLMELAPDVFKVGISGAPVTDWKNYEIMYGERYMDTPEQNPEGYEKSSTLNDVKNIKGKLLLIGGGLDYKTVPKNIADFLNACIEHNVYIDYCTFPNHDHDIGGKDKGYLIQKMIDYFNHNLK